MTAPEPTFRLFIALQLPDAWKDALARLQDEMRAALHERFGDSVRPRWVRPEGIHLTLKFLGATPASGLRLYIMLGSALCETRGGQPPGPLSPTAP